ncbi:hypothetical protein SO802_019597 [Lithocarpus litseifolius]|uniref:NAC domain-containing protein n=1 Tax=Lithocarpus litseifolius TaxID=425828 RepID=A0AAW2CT88_9ROSI
MNDLCKLEEEQLKEQNPPGFRFDPTDRELVKYYLKPGVLNKPLPELSFMEVDLYNQNPDTLAEQNIDYGEKVWYFFTPRNRKYQNGSRPNRAAGDGYWKANGADLQIKEKGVIIGFKKTLNFMRGKPPKGEKTGWIMHECKINAPAPTKRSENDMRLDDCVLCRIYNKKGRIRNEDEDHSKDASSISLPEDDRRELMENFNGAGQDYENLSNINVPAPLAYNMASFPYQFQAMDGNYGTYNMASFPNQFQAMDGNYGAYNMASVPNQFQVMVGNYGTSPRFVGRPMYFQSSYPRETSISVSAMIGNHGSLPQKIDQPIYFSPPEACELIGINGTPNWTEWIPKRQRFKSCIAIGFLQQSSSSFVANG